MGMRTRLPVVQINKALSSYPTDCSDASPARLAPRIFFASFAVPHEGTNYGYVINR